MSISSHEQIRVLHVDDEPSLTDLTATFLERESDRFAVETATSADDGLERINDRPPDCVVSDYNMPGTNGIEFLQAVREKYPDLPFILFTGKGSEAVASDAIAADVTDYLQKGSGLEKYELLANRIRNAAETRRESKRADRQEQLMRLTEFAGDTGGFELHTETGEVLLTDGIRRLVDLPTQADLSLDEAIDLYHPEDREDIQQTIDRARQTGEQTHGTWRLQTQDGDERLVDVTFTPTTTDGDTEILRGAVHDITDQHERQQELEEYETIIESLSDPVYVLDEEGRFTYVNDEFVELVGYDRETILGNRPSLIKDEEAVEQAENQLGRLLSSDGPETAAFEVTVHPRDGDPIVCEDHMGILPYEGDQFNGSVGTLRDITARKERERQLSHERKRYTTLFETLPNPVLHATVEDSEPIVQTVNPAFEDTFGYDAETIRDEPLHDYMLSNDQPDATHKLKQQVLTEGEVRTEVQLETTDGVRTFRLNVTTRNTETEDHEGYAVYTDITDRKQTERALEKEQDLVTGIVETVPVGIAVVDADDSISFVNEQSSTIAGWSDKAVKDTSYNHSRYDLVNEDGDPFDADDTPFDRVLSQETAIHDQIVGTRRPSGERVWLSVSGAPQYNDDGELERTVFAFEDITEQRELESELAEVLGRVSDGFLALDDEFRFTHVNGRAEELLQASEDDLLGETLWDVFPEAAEIDEIWDGLHAAMETQEPQSHELYYEPLGFWTGTKIYPSESGVSVYFRDITESKERKHELQQVRNRMAFALESTDAIVWDYNVDEDRATFYPDEEELYGATVETVDDFVQLIHPDDRQAVADSIEQSIETGDPIYNEFRIVRNGEIRWMDGSGQVVQDDDDTTRMTGVVRDITERKVREQQLEQFREYAERIRDAIDDLFFVHDTEGNPQQWNNAFTEVTGYSDEEIASMNATEFVTDEYRERTAAVIEEVFETGHARLEAPLLTKSGETIPYEYAADRVEHPDGDPRLVGVGRDISDRKEYERRLEAQNERLEEFTSVVSHDLRNPLQVADGRLELLREECESDHIDDVAQALDRMDALIEDLLTLAREGKQVDETEPVGVANVAKNSWQTVNTEQAALEPDTSRAVKADESRLRQLFENLYRNAVEHGSDDVTVSVGAMDDGFYVADTGSGIPESEREEIFEAGYSTSDEGTGFGLRIVEQIVDAHGWEITVTESEQGGARFEITGVERVD